MSIKVYFVSSNIEEASSTKIDDRTILGTLGDRNEAVAVQLKELFESVTEAIKPSIKTKSDVIIELTGSMDIKMEGSIKYLIFNAGASGTASGTMKVTLKTELIPD
ncbi:hypothetical protein [Youngiibacter multivorans]|uniref:Uncharacterized protein n=1 Tax=Youngiibacter multivorans TaxID=937251 RepID=A0ABS4G106_9CLOT|nr:hypothetical protein [Youngiibacter multivorans]MBP1918225.1 hypothetical protein [Youngiibacter multivorans]MBW8382263.1 hypothetical protein [Youngiibacter sp.]